MDLNKYNFNAHNVYHYGSFVYGVNSKFSDNDLIIISLDKLIEPKQETRDNTDITMYGVDYFQELVDNHEITALECLFLDNNHVIKKNHEFDFSLDLGKLRRAISSKASNSYVKAKKKMIVEGDDASVYIGKKSLWHSLRILKFGIQIATHGRIVDYKENNDLWGDIVLSNKCWDEYNYKYKPIYNELSTQFRKVAPKN